MPAGVVLLLLAACADLIPVHREEVRRAGSPDGLVDAVVMMSDAGATTSQGYFVHIVPRGDQVGKHTEVFAADHLNPDSLVIEWKSDALLRISTPRARIFRFRNVWTHREVHDFLHEIWIDLEASPAGPSAADSMP